MSDKDRGIYGKFKIERTDGSSKPGGKHHYCAHFVLDLDHDPYAVAALTAYADACRAEYPSLADDIDKVLRQPTACTRSLELTTLVEENGE